MKENIVLIGFMGVGKTSLGKLLASKLGRAFVDLDEKIEHDAAMSIPKIFENYGEQHFRELEKIAVREVSARRNIVIATGGGTVKDPENLQLLKNSGVIICLTTDPEEIFRRTEKRGERPMLDGGGNKRFETIKKLLDERQQFYCQADFQIDTTEWSPLQIVNKICDIIKQQR